MRSVSVASALLAAGIAVTPLACGGRAALSPAGSALPGAHEAALPRRAVAPLPVAKPSPPRDPLPSLDELAARGPSLAAGMREATRNESTVTHALRFDAVNARGRDVCARVLFVSTAPVVAKVEDGEGVVLAEVTHAAQTGALGESGPVCVRRDGVIRVAFDAAARSAVVRWVAWASP